MRPKTLAEVAELTANGGSFDFSLREFLDEFYAHPELSALADEPLRLAADRPEQGRVLDAYLAAVAETLGNLIGGRTPIWAFAEDRKLHHPWFALPYAGMRAVLLLESPAPFRSRNLFVSENALHRV